MATPRASTAVDCNVCGKTISRKADLPRHMRTHATNKEELMHACPYVGCPYRALQRSNLLTHLNVHSRERPNKCPAEGCAFTTSDPGSLTRHRKEHHGYEPKGNSFGSHASATTRKRQRRRNTPYTTSSSSSGSVSPWDPSSPSPSLLLADDHVEEGSKNTSAAYRTELITKLTQVNDSHLAPNTRMEDAPPFNSGLLTTSEAPAAEHPQLLVPEQGDLYAVDAAAQPVYEMTVSDEGFNNFHSQFNDWQSAPTPMVSYSVDNVPTPTILPPYAGDNAHVPAPTALTPYEDQYIVDHALIPTPASHPLYEVRYPVDNAPYGYYGYTTEAVSFDAQFSQPDSFVTPDMGVYPQAVYPQDVDQGYFYATYAGTSGFAMEGLYVN